MPKRFVLQRFVLQRFVLLFVALLLLSCKLPGALFDGAQAPGTAAPPGAASSSRPTASQPAATASATLGYILITPNPVLTHGAGSKDSPAATQADVIQPATQTPAPPAALPTDTPGPTPTAFPLPTQSQAEIPPVTPTAERTVIPPPYDPITMQQNWSALATSSATEAAILCACAQVIYVCEKYPPYGKRPSCSFRCIGSEEGDKFGTGANISNQFCTR